MQIAVMVMAKTLYAIFSMLLLTMFVYAILSWIESLRDNTVMMFIREKIIDPVTAPMRALLSRFELFRNSPIDFSFLLTSVIIMLLQSIVAIWA